MKAPQASFKLKYSKHLYLVGNYPIFLLPLHLSGPVTFQEVSCEFLSQRFIFDVITVAKMFLSTSSFLQIMITEKKVLKLSKTGQSFLSKVKADL